MRIQKFKSMRYENTSYYFDASSPPVLVGIVVEIIINVIIIKITIMIIIRIIIIVKII